VAAGLQQGEHQRGEFVAHWQAGEVDARCFAGQRDREGWNARGAAVFTQADLVRAFEDVVEQGAHFLALGAVIQRANQFDGALQAFEIGLQLAFDGGVEHGVSPYGYF